MSFLTIKSTLDYEIHGVIFDLDGLLVDTERLVNQALSLVSRDLLERDLPPGFFRERAGLNRFDSYHLLAKYIPVKVSEQAFTESFEVYYSDLLKTEISPKPGAMELISFLETQKIPRAIATSSSRALAYRKLEGAGIRRDRFSFLVTADDVARRKPSPDAYSMAASRLQIRPELCLALEDSPHGVEAANAAQVPVIWVPDNMRVQNELGERTICILQSLYEVRELLTQPI